MDPLLNSAATIHDSRQMLPFLTVVRMDSCEENVLITCGLCLLSEEGNWNTKLLDS